MRVMRTRGSLRMILYAEQRQIPMPQAFQRRVIQIHVRELDFTLRQRIRVDREIVIVRRDLNLSRLQLLNRMIPAVVPELQLVRLPAQRNARQLMSEANPKDRLPSHEPSNR